MILLGFDQPEAQSGCPVVLKFSFRDIRRLLKDYTILEIRKDLIFPYKVEKYIRYEHERVPWFKWMPNSLFKFLEHPLGGHTLIRCKLKTGGKLK